MFAKTVFVVFCATLAVSMAFKDDGDIVNTVLGSTSNLIKEVAKVATNDPEKYSVDLNSLYKKYEVADKANQARSYLQTQFKRGIELTNEYIKKADVQSEEDLKKSIEVIKKEDPALGEKLNRFYEKTCELDRISEEIVKYILDADKIQGYYDKAKSSLRPYEQNLIETIKKFEATAIEAIKKGKGKF